MEPERFDGVHGEITGRIMGVFYQVYNELGFGFLEPVYREAMRIALVQSGLRVEAERRIPVYFRGQVAGLFRADLVVEGLVILELKVADRILKQHEAQMIHYLRSTTPEVGLVLNFGEAPLVRRMILTNDRKKAIPVASESQQAVSASNR